MSTKITKCAFEIAIEHRLLDHGFISVNPGDFERQRAIFPETVLSFIRET
jgi:hypothetical protein